MELNAHGRAGLADKLDVFDEQQVIFGRYPDRPIQELDLDTGAVQFIHQKYLVRIVTGQAIR